MIIISIHIKNYGKLSDYSLSFDRHLHIVEGENESGKSTVASFIRYMLYGFDHNDTTSYGRGISRSSKTAQGSMIVECKGRRYKIERFTSLEGTEKKPIWHESDSITDLETNEITQGICAGDRFLGIPRSIYRRIACIGQLNEPRVDDMGMRESIENLLFSGDEKVNIKHAVSALTRRRELLLSVDGKTGDIARLAAQREKFASRLTEAIDTNRLLIGTQAKLDTTRAEIKAEQAKLTELTDIEVCYRNTQLLLAFDKLHETKRQTNEISAKLIELKKQNSHKDFIPDAEYLTEISVNRRVYAESEAACRQAEADLIEIEGAEVISSEVQNNLHYAMNHGGEEAVFADAKRLHKKTVRSAFFAVFTAILALAIAGAATFVFSAFGNLSFDPEKRLPYYLIFGISFLLCTAGDVLLWIHVHSCSVAERAFYIDFGARSFRQLSLRMRHIDEYRKKAADHIMRLRAAHKYRERTAAALKSARAELEASVVRWGRELPDTDILVYTDEVEKAARTYIDTINMLREDKSRLDATASQLIDQLKNRSEDIVRSQVPEGSIERMSNIKPEEIAARVAEQKRKCDLLSNTEKLLEDQLNRLKDKAIDPARMSENLIRDTEIDLAEATKTYDALTRALSTFNDVDDRLKARITPRLASHALELVRSITGGTYDDLEMSDNLALMLKRRGEGFSTELLSAGTRDVAYMALRIAMIAMVCRDELPPLCLDESFAYQDDTRAQGIMKMLKIQSDKGLQNLIFTCRPREEILAHQAFGTNIGYTKMEAVS